jgi:nicotinamide mononucleotide transporter
VVRFRDGRDEAPCLPTVNALELGANAFVAVAIFLAGRNNIHTWWTGIVGCALFGWVFFHAKLYADVTLQGFFIVTSIYGWWKWLHGDAGRELPVRFSDSRALVAWGTAATLVAAAYGWLLLRFTDAYAPFLDSVVLAFSVLGQLLMMERRVENWWSWLLVNTIAVPLYASRGLYVTAVLYAAFWINAVVSLVRWRALALRAARVEHV